MRATGRGRLDDLCGATSTGSVARGRTLLTHERDRAHAAKETLLPWTGRSATAGRGLRSSCSMPEPISSCGIRTGAPRP